MLIQIEKDGKSVIKQMKGKGDVFNITLPKSLCGSYTYYTRVSLEGVNNSTSAILGFRGYCPQKITKSEWRKSPKGANIANGTPIKYGDTIYLYLETEGLNGEKLTVEVYNSVTLLSDTLIRKIVLVEVEDGRVALKIPNTTLWMGAVSNIQEVEEFYVKIKNAKGQYILNSKQEEDHAEYLKIKKEVSSTNIEKPSNTTVLKIGETTVKLNRHEPCKFEEISITETETKDGKATNSTVKVFDNGKGLKSAKGTTEKVTTSIYFKFDVDVVDEKSKQALQNVLNFLLEHPHSGIRLEGYACVIGKQNYNNGLSQRRSDAVKKFFLDGGLKADRILSLGKGEVNATDDKQGRDNIKYKDEKEYINNRRVDVSFTFEGHNAQTIVYETIAPSSDKNILLEVKGFETKSCFKTKDKHTKKIKVTSPAYPAAKVQNGDKMQIPVHSTLEAWNPAPLNYIWPSYNILKKGESTNKYFVFINSCRYFSSNENNIILLKAFPDIKWDLKFSLNLTNDLSVKWMNASESQHKEFQKKSGKIGAEKRWKQKEASINFSLKAKWNNDEIIKELKLKYEDKFKKLYDVFSSIGNLSEGITSKTKGKVSAVSSGIPATFAVKPPNLEFTANWLLKKVEDQTKQKTLGTDVKLGLGANPLIGLEVTIDLLGTIVYTAAGLVSGGAAAPGVLKLYQKIKDSLKEGLNVGEKDMNAKYNVDIYMDLVITGTMNINSNLQFNTALKPSDSKLDIKSEAKLAVELKVGVKILGEVTVVIIKIRAYFEASAKSKASITFGQSLKYDDKGLYLRPILGFDGMDAEYIIKVSAGLALKLKKGKLSSDVSNDTEHTIAQGKYEGVLPPFDIIKELETLTGFDANIKLISN
ncbi:MAG: OmpA family protein [Limnohabitans sp.]|nr:OmpA family protein [Limnohabitans sp.]